MGLVCGTPASFVPAAAAARTALATTITPALGAGVKTEKTPTNSTAHKDFLGFQNKAKICTRHLFVPRKIICKFGENIYKNPGDRKVFVKNNVPDLAEGR